MKKIALAALLLTLLGGGATQARPHHHSPWIDISLAVEEGKTPVYPGDPPIRFTFEKSLAKGDVANVSKLEMGAHTGTHIDAPSHFIANGATIDQISLDHLIGPALVIECSPQAGIIDVAELKRHPWKGAKRILFKTHNSYANFYADPKFHTDFTALAPDAAQLLADKGVVLVGIDYLSIEKFGSKVPRTHQILLAKGIVIVEGLDLREVKGGRYHLQCLPARLKGREAAPTRAILKAD